MRHKNAAIFSVLMLGFTAMLSQIVVIRELLVVFSGNELSVGIMFAGWLAWGALGSFFSASLRRPVRSARSYAVYQAALAFSLPLAVILIRVSRGMAGMSTGEIIGFLPMILIVLGVLSIPCFLMGAMFSLGCRLYREAGQDASESITHVYVLEAAGALFGGIAGTGLIALSIPPLYVILGLAIINFFSSFVIFLSSRRENRNGPFLGIFLLAGFLCAVFILSGGGKALNGFSEKILWKGFDVAVSRDSVYGNLVITKEKDQISLYENGLHVCTVPDALSAENAVHFAMLGTERPERVLLIGGGAGGALEEILKYQVKHIDYLELDPALLPLLRGYIGHTPAWEDRRVSVINTDGRAFVKRTDEKYDCVIVNLGDPYTAQINRFYTADFFEEVKKCLSPKGLMSFSVTSSENYIGGELGDYLGSLYISAEKVFPEVLLLPGDPACFLAARSKGVIEDDWEEMARRLYERGVTTKYVKGGYLSDRFARTRLDQIAGEMGKRYGKVEVNSDLDPISYLYAVSFWNTHFDGPGIAGMLKGAKRPVIWAAAAAICGLILLFFILGGRRARDKAVLGALTAAGFSEMIMQVAVILSFQAIYGYAFYKIGIIIASFMAGLALGGVIWGGISRNFENKMKALILVQIGVCIMPLSLPLLFVWLSGTHSAAISALGAGILLPLSPLVFGVLGGIQFPLAAGIYREGKSEIGHAAGIAYGADLTGACIGALLGASLLIPVLGIVGACFAAALMNVTILAVLMLS